MKDWQKDFETMGAKLNELGKLIDDKLEGLETVINDKIQVYVTRFVDDNEKRRRERAERNKDNPVYEYHANGFTTHVYKDGTKTVTPEKEEEKKEKTKGDKILGMVPFLDEESLHELTLQFLDGDLEIEMQKVLPFLGEKDIALLMKKIAGNNGEPFKALTLAHLLPFADEQEISRIFMQKAKQGVIDEELISYVDSDCWHEIVVDYCENKDSNLDIDKIYPHLDERDLKLLFKTYLTRQK